MRFGVYINPAARLRESDGAGEPEPAYWAALVEAAGAHLILAGWSPTGGLLKERDFKLIRELVHGDLHLLAPLGSEYVDAVVKLKPEGVVMVAAPWDAVQKPATLNLDLDAAELAAAATAYQSAGLSAAAFVEPDAATVKTAAKCGVAGLVFDASLFATSRTDRDAQEALDRISDASMAANKFGLATAAARGLNTRTAAALADLRYLDEIYAGRAVVNRALQVGVDRAVGEFLAVVAGRGG